MKTQRQEIEIINPFVDIIINIGKSDKTRDLSILTFSAKSFNDIFNKAISENLEIEYHRYITKMKELLTIVLEIKNEHVFIDLFSNILQTLLMMTTEDEIKLEMSTINDFLEDICILALKNRTEVSWRKSLTAYVYLNQRYIEVILKKGDVEKKDLTVKVKQSKEKFFKRFKKLRNKTIKIAKMDYEIEFEEIETFIKKMVEEVKSINSELYDRVM